MASRARGVCVQLPPAASGQALCGAGVILDGGMTEAQRAGPVGPGSAGAAA